MAFGLGTGAEKGRIVGYTQTGEAVYEGDMKVGSEAGAEDLSTEMPDISPFAKALREGNARKYGAPVGSNSNSEALPSMPNMASPKRAPSGGGSNYEALPPLPEPLGGPRTEVPPLYPSGSAAGYGQAGKLGGGAVPPAPTPAPLSKAIPPTPAPIASEGDEGSNAGMYAAGAGGIGLASILAQRRNAAGAARAGTSPALLGGATEAGGTLSPLGRETAGRKPAKGGAVGEAKLKALPEGQKVLPGSKTSVGSPKPKVAREGKPLQLGEGQKVLPGSSKKALPSGKTPLQLTDPNAPWDLSFLDPSSGSEGYIPHPLTPKADGKVWDLNSLESYNGIEGRIPRPFTPKADEKVWDLNPLESYDGIEGRIPRPLKPKADEKLPAKGSKSAMGGAIGEEGKRLAAAKTALKGLGTSAKASQIAETLAPHVFPSMDAHYKSSMSATDGIVKNPDAVLSDMTQEVRKIYGKAKPQKEISAIAGQLAKLFMGRK